MKTVYKIRTMNGVFIDTLDNLIHEETFTAQQYAALLEFCIANKPIDLPGFHVEIQGTDYRLDDLYTMLLEFPKQVLQMISEIIGLAGAVATETDLRMASSAAIVFATHLNNKCRQ